VAPYRDLYNSGVVMLALSLARPVLLLPGDVARGLQSEFGPEWVRVLPPPMSARDLAAAATELGDRRGRPPFAASRDWDEIGRRHAAVYAAARAARPKRPHR
jgi:beta-1,4-mannosyltransferase